MRYWEIIEGIRMGARDISRPPKKPYTVGFEFEVAVKNNHPLATSDDDDDDDESRFYDAQERFSDWWYGGGSTFDFEEWFTDQVRYDHISISDLVADNDFEPRYGWVVSVDDYLNFRNREIKEAWQRKFREFDQDFLKKAVEYYNEYEKNPDKILGDRDRINEILTLFQRHRYSPKMSQEKFDERIKTALNTTSDERAINFLKGNMEFTKEYIDGPELLTKDSEDFDFDPDDREYLYDSDRRIISLNDTIEISTVDDITELFDVKIYELNEALAEEANEAEIELMSNEFDRWYSNRNSGSSSGGSSKINYVLSRVKSEVDSWKDWEFKEDATPGVDAEFVPKPYVGNIEDGIKVMKDVFNFIKNDEYIYTARPTGLHINIGTFSRDEIAKIDWLKFLIVYRADRVLAEFNRTTSGYAGDKLRNIIQSLETGNYAELYKNVSNNNDIVIKISQKMSSINLSKLSSWGIIELRAPGNAGYETKGNYLEKEIRRIARALDIARDPESYKKEYIKKLYQMVGDVKGDPRVTSSNPVDAFLSKVSNTYNPKSKITMLDKIINIIRNPGGFNPDVANKEYTLPVHNAIMGELKKNPNNSYTDLMYYLKAGNSDVVKNSKFIRLILSSLSKLENKSKYQNAEA